MEQGVSGTSMSVCILVSVCVYTCEVFVHGEDPSEAFPTRSGRVS